MRIGNGTIAMASEHTYVSAGYIKYAGSMAKRGGEVKIDTSLEDKSPFEQMQEAEAKLMEEKTNGSSDAKRAVGVNLAASGTQIKCVSSVKDLRILLLNKLIEALERRSGRSGIESPYTDSLWSSDFTYNALSMRNTMGSNVGFSGTYVKQTVVSSFYAEQETTAFVSNGKVTTKDGREIDINVSFEMSRSFTESVELYTKEEYIMCDPLVINFTGNPAELSDQKFLFDLDGDGQKDEISYLGKGSGFLALDKNGDGVINDGTELFGTKSGNGFHDLSMYDEDGNGWIDEDDSVFKSLKIWVKNENGEDELIGIGEAGLGAICLNSISTEFSMNGMEDNHTNGMIRQSGIYLNENGSAGIIQHVDFAI